MPHAYRAVSDVISSSVLAGERGGQAGGELAIYIKLKWFKTNPCHYNDNTSNDGYAAVVPAVHLFSHASPCRL